MEDLLPTTIELLSELIRTPSLSREEKMTADLIAAYLTNHGVHTERSGHNIWCTHPDFNPSRPTLLLNSHHDTVRPNHGYLRDPYEPELTDGKLFGLGSNDAGGSLVCLINTFVHYHRQEKLDGFNLVLAATAEEEISGPGGVESILDQLPPIDMAIVGEPTSMQMAVAEKGLLVIDCLSRGVAGHSARNEGKNAIYVAMDDLEWFRNFEFDKVSEMLGPVRMNVTIIAAGTQHNVIPDECRFTVDVRTTNEYSLEETLEIIRSHVSCETTPRSVRLRPSGLPPNHPLERSAHTLGIATFGSPTMSDQALMPFPSIKMGPGDSERSHSPDEFIFVDQLEEGLSGYRDLLAELSKQLKTI